MFLSEDLALGICGLSKKMTSRITAGKECYVLHHRKANRWSKGPGKQRVEHPMEEGPLSRTAVAAALLVFPSVRRISSVPAHNYQAGQNESASGGFSLKEGSWVVTISLSRAIPTAVSPTWGHPEGIARKGPLQTIAIAHLP